MGPGWALGLGLGGWSTHRAPERGPIRLEGSRAGPGVGAGVGVGVGAGARAWS
jgi:hypothetical protein